MPRKGVVSHGTQAKQQTTIEHYKVLKNYKELALALDGTNNDIQNIYENNIWDLKSKFQDLSDYYEQIGVSSVISWNNKIQYLDLTNIPILRPNISLEAFRRGDYKAIGVDKPNSISTEKDYANRLSFYTRTFDFFKQYQDKDDFTWVLQYNRLLTYYIMKYNNDKNNALSSLNNDFKTIIRAIKIILLDPENEIRYKFSALQIALGDIERLKDDLNEITTKRELNSFIPYEQLLDIIDTLEQKYNNELSKLPAIIQNDGTKHSNNLFQLHQLLIATAINVWDYPSRLDKYDMEIITSETEIKPNKCYILVNKDITFIFNNDKKKHKPLTYKLNAKPILGLNKRLNNLLMNSLTLYPRKSLFISSSSWGSKQLTAVKEATISKWISDIVPNKSLNIGTFRSSFVSYYYPKSNNQAKELMRIRMRTSRLELERAYLKFYSSPNELVKVKVEPNDDLINRANMGNINNPITLNNVKVKADPNNDNMSITLNTPKIKVVRDTYEIRRQNAKKWYADPKNRAEHLKKVNEVSKDPKTYGLRYVRELNSGKISIEKMKQETIDKFKIEYVNGKFVSMM